MPGPVDVNALSLPDLWRELTCGGLAHRLIELARDEDLGPDGLDITAAVAAGEAGEVVDAVLNAREPGVVAGLAAVPMVLDVFDVSARVAWRPLTCDGQKVQPERRAHDTPNDARFGSPLGVLTGPRRDIVVVERTLLNLIARLSGIATRTASFVDLVRGTAARVYDTRKTTPGLRVLEKYAVRCGGGCCHRLGLFDAVLLKDNHVAGLGLDGFEQRVREAAARARGVRDRLRFVMIEVDGLDQLERVLGVAGGARGVIDVVLLDNFDVPTLRQAVTIRAGHGMQEVLAFEASGGVNERTIRGIAETGVERISIGGLTHHAVSLDVGLDVRPDGGQRTGPAPR